MSRPPTYLFLLVLLAVVVPFSVPAALAGDQDTDAGLLGVEYRTVDVVATFDNSTVFSTTDSTAADTVYSSGENAIGCVFSVGPWATEYVCYGTLVYFELPADVSGASIVSATLQLYPEILPADWNTTYGAGAVAETWDPSTVTWNSAPDVYDANRQFVNPPTNTVLPTEWDATSWVQSWASGAWDNFGVTLWDTSSILPAVTSYRSTYFGSLEWWFAYDRRPTLHIEYEVQVPDPPPSCRGDVATIWGTDAGETLIGTDGDDVIVGLGGADTIYGNGGNDVICAGRGPDTVYGGTGKDKIYGQNGADTIYGNSGADRIEGGLKPDTIKGGNGNDKLFGGRGGDTLRGGNHADTLFGNAGTDRLGGDAGSPDVCNGGVATDTHIGGCETIISIP